ncbi:hypothetical protein BDV25DRAFT_149759 [Aspergillus avenaceus]|uniref:Uncharacterized protein n=1 Tax=Aspergillus avenaceus TaxID=36643 RepID=A0A5N6U4Y2_ASPAV|nr:hypothetical protein BDV25DRAFT_149759 [Aspergillus avenaceus]
MSLSSSSFIHTIPTSTNPLHTNIRPLPSFSHRSRLELHGNPLASRHQTISRLISMVHSTLLPREK